jgi:serine/threonine-protein kinase
VDGRFAVRSVVAHGGTAVVVAAEHLRLRQLVALKFLRPEYASNQSLTARFLREARAAASLRSEHVVNVTDVGMLPDGAPYLVMEYLDGESLAARLKASGPLPIAEVVEYALQALEALAEAHAAGIVHRDLKPDNLVVLGGPDETALLKIIDFGISKLTGPEVTHAELTKNNSFMGSLMYASPEQIRDSSQVDARSDIWSLGVTLYELLTGRTPFQSRTTAGLIWEICEEEPTPLGELEDYAPSELFSIVSRCLEKDPGARFACVQDMARAFHPLARSAACQLAIERIVRRRSGVPPVVRTPASIPPVWKSLNTSSVRSDTRLPSKRSVGLVAAAAFAVTSLGLFTLLRASPPLEPSEAARPHTAATRANAAPATIATALAPPRDPEPDHHEAIPELLVVSPRSLPVRKEPVAALDPKPHIAAEVPAAAPTPNAAREPVRDPPARTPRTLDAENPFAR